MDRYYTFIVTAPANTPQAAPASGAVTLENAMLVDVEIIIPPGHAGLTGIQVRQSGTPIVPFGIGRFLTGDGYQRVFDVNTEIGSKAISIAAYNTDAFSHDFPIRFHLRDINTTPAGPGTTPGSVLASAINDTDGTLINTPGLPEAGPLPDVPINPLTLPPPFVALPDATSGSTIGGRHQYLLSVD